jgi:V-type H+-transporting ATPase subunit G
MFFLFYHDDNKTFVPSITVCVCVVCVCVLLTGCAFVCCHSRTFSNPTTITILLQQRYTGRGDRMKQAKADGAELIASYKAEKQEEFNNMVLSKGGSEGNASAKLQEETNSEVVNMEALFQKNAQKAVDVLLSKCCEVSLEVPTARVRATRKIAGLAN